MAKKKGGYAQLSADLVKRTVAQQTKIIGPDGSIETVWAIVQGQAA